MLNPQRTGFRTIAMRKDPSPFEEKLKQAQLATALITALRGLALW